MKSILNFLGIHFLPVVINIYLKTIKIEITNKPDFKKNFIFIFWHSKMLAGWYLFKDINSAALVSQSKDGEILNNLLLSWNYKVVRGSSSRGGKDALNSLNEFVKNGFNAVITPDGPRGPAMDLKNGAFIISNKCSVPIIPVKIQYERKRILNKSWDKFEIPLPFSKCYVTFGNEYNYNEFLGKDDLEIFKSKLSSEL